MQWQGVIGSVGVMVGLMACNGAGRTDGGLGDGSAADGTTTDATTVVDAGSADVVAPLDVSDAATPLDVPTTPDVPTAVDVTPTGDAGALVAQCQALASTFATLCTGDDQRPCMWNAYRQLCVTGNTQLLLDSMRCLDATTCRTFSDANDANACILSVHAREDTTAARTAASSFCTACGVSDCSTVDLGEVLTYLSDQDLGTLSTCGGSTCDLTTLITSCAAAPGIAPFVSCASP